MVDLSCAVHIMTAAVEQGVTIKAINEVLFRIGSKCFFLFSTRSIIRLLGMVLNCVPEQSQKNVLLLLLSLSLSLSLFFTVIKNRSSSSWVVNCCPSHPSDQLTLITVHYFIKA